MTSRLLLAVTLLAFIPAVWWAWSEAAVTVELFRALFNLDIQIGGEQ